MKSIYVKELEKLTFSDLKNRLDASDEETRDVIKSLQFHNRRIIKPYSNDGEMNEEWTGMERGIYSFDFVGVAIYKRFVIKCYPKYLNADYMDREKEERLKTILQVLRKYGKSEEKIAGMTTEEQHNEFNLLSAITFIISDYVENGLYTNQQEIYEINGNGEIDWDKTVNENTAFLVNNSPFYFDMVTRNAINDEIDFFRQMHKYVITQCSNILKETGLAHILSLPIIEFEVDESLFYDNEYVLNRIMRELNLQFSSRKQLVLKTLYAFFSKSKQSTNDQMLSVFGTMNFNLVWEKTCAFVLNNQLHHRIDKIEGIDNTVLSQKEAKKTLIDLVPYPNWIPKEAKDPNEYKKPRKTIQLDLISIFKKERERYFVIWDAKYYNLTLTLEKLENNPGVEDIIKQYVYYLAFADFINKQNFDYSYNVLLFPSERAEIEVIGKVEFDILQKALNVDGILVMKMPANIVFDMYLQGKMLNVGKEVSFEI